jgi:hypothetical protein
MTWLLANSINWTATGFREILQLVNFIGGGMLKQPSDSQAARATFALALASILARPRGTPAGSI